MSGVLRHSVKSLTDCLDSHQVDGAFISKADPQISLLEVQRAVSVLVIAVIDKVQKLLEAIYSIASPASPWSDMNEYVEKDIRPSHDNSQTTVEDADVTIWFSTCKSF